MLNASESYRPKESTSLEMEKNPATARLGRKSGRKRDIITFRCWGSHDTPVIFHSTWAQRAAEEGNKKDGEPIQRLCARGCHSWESVVRDLTRKQCTGENISSCWFPDRHCSEPLIHALETRAASFRGALCFGESIVFARAPPKWYTLSKLGECYQTTTRTRIRTKINTNPIWRNLAWKINRSSWLEKYVSGRRSVDLQFALIPYIKSIGKSITKYRMSIPKRY